MLGLLLLWKIPLVTRQRQRAASAWLFAMGCLVCVCGITGIRWLCVTLVLVWCFLYKVNMSVGMVIRISVWGLQTSDLQYLIIYSWLLWCLLERWHMIDFKIECVLVLQPALVRITSRAVGTSCIKGLTWHPPKCQRHCTLCGLLLDIVLCSIALVLMHLPLSLLCYNC